MITGGYKADLIRSRFSDPGLSAGLLNECIEVVKPAGTILLDQGLPVSHMPILLHGLIKVLRFDRSGKELLLYYVKAGETCAFTALAVHTHRSSSITAICEETCTLLLVPAHAHEQWFSKFEAWKSFIFNALEKRFGELLLVVDHLAFHPVADRLYDLLAEKKRLFDTKMIHTTHQELADELNTSREVVSRILKQMEKAGRVELHRNQIRLIGP